MTDNQVGAHSSAAVTSMTAREAHGMLASPGTRVLLASSGTYAPGSRLKPVPAAKFSVTDLGRCLKEQAGLDPEHLTLLIDPASPQDFSAALEEAAAQAQDVLFFGYVGHGLVSAAKELHLATHATIDINRGVPEYQALPYSTVKQIIRRCPAKLIVIVLDCCFSALAEEWAVSHSDDPFDAARQQGVYVLASAGHDELAWAPPGRYTAFTGALIRLLTAGEPAAPPQLTLDAVYRCLSCALPEQGLPRPRRYAADQIDAVPLAPNPANHPSLPLPADTPRHQLDGFSPYRGLAAFEAEDAQFFFGREDLTRTVLDLLAERLSTICPLVVTGPSGSGKSSLLRAGLIPALQQMEQPTPGRSRPLHFFLTPGTDPLRNLVKRIAAVNRTSPSDLRERVAADPASFVTALQEARSVYAVEHGLLGEPLVIVVDQFEEIFAPDIPEVQRQAFIDALCAACRKENAIDPSALVVLGVRADFFGHCATYPQLVHALERPVVVGPMSANQLRTVITKPAELAGLVLEDGLVELLLQDLETTGRSTGGQAGALPLLSHALLVIWQERRGTQLTLAGDHASGGIARSLAQTGDATLGRLDLAGQQIARGLLLRLVQLGDGTEDTRRCARLTEILPAHDAPDRAAVSHVLDLFVRARLITVDTDTVEITHEALIRAWPQLRAWIDADRARLLARQQLTQDASAWERSGREPAFLYSNSRLSTAQAAAREHHRFELTSLELAFLDASSRRARRRTRRAGQLIAALTALLVLAVSSGIVAFQQRIAANHERDLALSRLVATQANQLRGTDPSLAMQLSLAAYRISPTTEAHSSLIDATASPAATRMLGSLGAEIPSVAFNPGKAILAAGSANMTVQMWSVLRAGHPVRLGPALTGPSASVTSVVISPNGRILAAGTADGAVWLWNLGNPRRPAMLARIFLKPTGVVNSIAFSANGSALAVASSDGSVYLYDVANPRHASLLGSPLIAGIGSVNSVTFSPVQTILAAGGSNGRIRLWNLRNFRPAARVGELLTGPVKAVNSVAFSPDGRTLAAGSDDDNVWLWNITREQRPIQDGPPLTGPASWVYSVNFSPDGKTIAAGSADNTAYVWDLTSRALLAKLPHPGPVISLTYGRDSHALATGDADGVARMWLLPGPVLTRFKDSVFTVAFSPDGANLVAASGDGLLRRWDVANPSDPTPLGSPLTASGLDGTVAYGPDGRIAAGSGDGSIELWNVRDPARPVRLRAPASDLKSAIQYVAFDRSGHLMAAGSTAGNVELWNVSDFAGTTPISVLTATVGGPGHDVFAVAFSPDDHLLAAASNDGTVRLWKIADPRHPRQLGHPLTRLASAVYQVAFSPNGNILAASGEDGKVRLWSVIDPNHPQLLSILSGPIGIIYDVSFSPDGHSLATASGDKIVSLWNITDPTHPRSLGSLTGPAGTVFSVAFSPSGNAIAAGSQDDTTRLWLTNPDSAASYICSIVGDPITRAEWVRYIYQGRRTTHHVMRRVEMKSDDLLY